MSESKLVSVQRYKHSAMQIILSEPTNETVCVCVCAPNVEKNAGQNGNAVIRLDGSGADCAEAKSLIMQTVNSERSDSRDGRRDDRDRADEHKRRIEIPSHKVGTVIGRGGSMIKELQAKFRVYIKVDRDENPNRNIDVMISGNRSDVELAENEIMKLTRDDDMPARQQHSEPEPVDVEPAIDWQAAAKQCVRHIYTFRLFPSHNSWLNLDFRHNAL